MKFPELKKPAGKKMNDPIADFIIRIKNSALAKRGTVLVPYSKLKESLALVLQKSGFLSKVEVNGNASKKQLVVTLEEEKNQPRLIEVRRISKPGRRVYVKAADIKTLTRGLGTVIISTPVGILSHKDALKKNLGGEVLCKII